MKNVTGALYTVSTVGNVQYGAVFWNGQS